MTDSIDMNKLEEVYQEIMEYFRKPEFKLQGLGKRLGDGNDSNKIVGLGLYFLTEEDAENFPLKDGYKGIKLFIEATGPVSWCSL